MKRNSQRKELSLIHIFSKDDEFRENYEHYYDQFVSGYTDMTLATEAMAYMCDNAYRRIKDETCSAHLKVNVDKSGNIYRVSNAQLDYGAFIPTVVTAGEFSIFAKTARTVVKKASNIVAVSYTHLFFVRS